MHTYIYFSIYFSLYKKTYDVRYTIQKNRKTIHNTFYELTPMLTDFFQNSKGLRQGEPLSLYLFVLVMEAFSRLLVETRGGGFIFGFLVRKSCGLVEVTHLLYANGTIIFCEANVEHLMYLNSTLM